jgi:hypothetical protein
MESLTSRVLRYQKNGAERDAIVRDIARKVYDYPRRKCGWDEESSSQFFERVFPKVGKMIERFRDVGRPFESYLASMLMFQVRSFAKERRRGELEWELSADPGLWDDGCTARAEQGDGAPPEEEGVAEQIPDRPGSAAEAWESLDPRMRELLRIGADGVIHSKMAQRRFIVLILKSAHLLSDGDVAAIARIAATAEEELHRSVQTLRSRHEEKARRVELFTERRNRAFYGLRVVETRLAREAEPERRRDLELRRKRLLQTVRGCQRTIARIRVAPSHRQIAESLGMPKATVDSTIHRLKARAALLYARRHEEYA